MNILVIEDDTNIAFAIERFLTNQGHKVIHSKSLEEAYAFYPERQDFVLLDLNLPDGDGFEYLSYIRSEGIKTPVILLTVLDQEKDIVRGLETGADDYLTKPFSLPVLKARMESVLRRIRLESSNDPVLQCGGISLDQDLLTLQVDGEVVELSQKELELVTLFLKNIGRTLTRERIIDLLWGWERGDVFDNTLSVTVKRLREKLKPYQHTIKTIRGIGYCMTEVENEG